MDRFKNILSRKKKAAGPDSDGEEAGKSSRELHRLLHAVEDLSFLNELAREIGASHDSKDVMEKIIRRSLRAMRAVGEVLKPARPLAPNAWTGGTGRPGSTA